MKWITRERPKIDRIASPWLIKRFVDPEAEFHFVPATDVLSISEETKAIPFDIPDVEYSHYGEEVTFDFIIKKHQLQDPALHKMAIIVRGADTDRHDLAPEVAGLWAISAGLSHHIQDDHELLDKGFVIYDALYVWAKHLSRVRHLDGSPFEKMLHEVFLKFLKNKKGKTPTWVKDLKHMIQDYMDAQYNIELRQLSEALELNTSYLSREFPRHFDNQSFGEYIRNARVQKALDLLQNSSYTLTEIAYMTGFSDQSHFTRVFKQQIGQSPSNYRKNTLKGKLDTKQ